MRWLTLLLILGAAIVGLSFLLLGGGSASSTIARVAEERVMACVHDAPRPRVGGNDGSVVCLREVGSAIPRCGPSASTPIGLQTIGQGREAITTDDGHGGPCARVLPPPGTEAKGTPGAAGCAQAETMMRADGLTVKRFYSKRCPRLGHLRNALSGLSSGRTDLNGLANDFHLQLDLARDGVPVGGGFRSLPPAKNRPVPAVSRLPVSGACSPRPSQTRLATGQIEPDVPAPRCLTVASDQGLRIVNRTNDFGMRGRAITVRFIGFKKRIRPGQAAVFPRPFASYIAPGDHFVISTYHGNGPEVLLSRR
jgi:hypothetical protein